MNLNNYAVYDTSDYMNVSGVAAGMWMGDNRGRFLELQWLIKLNLKRLHLVFDLGFSLK